MVGRRAELATIGGRIDAARAGRGQIVGIVAEAGMGKSRLAAEVLRLALQATDVYRPLVIAIAIANVANLVLNYALIHGVGPLAGDWREQRWQRG